VTGANRGLGKALVEEALRRDAKRVYAGARQSFAHADMRVTPLTLDVTSSAQIRAAVGKVDALDILINNAEMPEARTTITATGIKKDSSSTSNVYSYRCERSRFSKSSSYYIKSATCVVAIRAGPAV
jgi:NAD(P)-dependent dehydrogenase (short-subunit alcohol dehydrogenase family)